MAKNTVIDTLGRVWRRCAIPDGVTLANGQSKEQIQKELKEKEKIRKEQEKRSSEKARRKAKAKREKASKEWEERPHILYTPMGNKRYIK